MVHGRFGRATPPTRAMVAMAAVLALLLGAVVTAGRAGADDEWTVVGGHVDWGVKASFRAYVTGPGGGSATADAGATVNGDGTFRFPATGGTVSAEGSSVAASTEGAVHFSAHAGALAIDLWDLRVEVDGASGTLVADATSTPLSGGTETYDDVAVATLDLSAVTPTDDGGTRTWSAVPATMHADGVGIFDSYPEGTALDPVTVVLELEAPATTTTSEAPTTTTTEAPTTTTTDAPTTTTTEGPGWEPQVTVSKVADLAPSGETVTVSGSGFDPDANTGTRPPVAGQKSGVYVTFGRFAEVWQPSAGAPGTARQVIDQRWALPAASIAYAVENYGPNAAYVELTAEGTFSTTLTLSVDDTKTGDYGVATYVAGGATADASQETFTPVAFAPSATTTTEAPTTTTTEAPTTTTTAPGTGVAVTGGHLDWGVKTSFRNYVVSPVAGGSVTTAGGASANADGTYRFPATDGTATADGSSFEATFGGSVRFTGHGGELDLLLTGLEVEADGTTGALVADVTSHAIGAEGAESYPDVELAVLDLSGVTPGSVGLTVTWSDVAAALTEAGAPAFGGFYAAGEALDPLTVVLDVESTTVPNPPTDPSSPPAAVDRTSYAPGDPLTVTGRGFLPGEQVEVWLHSDPQWVGTAVAGADGTVSYTFTLPLDLEPGLHHVELVGVTSGLVLETAAFTVAAGAATPAVTGAGTLPYTGSDASPLVFGGLVLLVAGAALSALTLRRSRRARPVG